MDQAGPSKRKAELPIPGDVTSAKKSTTLDYIWQKSIVGSMLTAYDIEILDPEEINKLDKNTKALALDRILKNCGVSTKAEEMTVEDLQSEQEKIQRQIDAIKRRKEENSIILAEQKRVEDLRSVLLQRIQSRRFEIRAVEHYLRRDVLPEGHRPVAEGMLQRFRQKVDRMQNQLNDLVLPLKSD